MKNLSIKESIHQLVTSNATFHNSLYFNMLVKIAFTGKTELAIELLS
jgi:hypothetical protein